MKPIIDQRVGWTTLNSDYPVWHSREQANKTNIINYKGHGCRWSAPNYELLYQGIKRILIGFGLDSENADQPKWNPFKTLICPGQTVLIKPNWVLDINRRGDFSCLVTHSSLIYILTNLAIDGLQGKGKIIIADAPLQSCNFNILLAKTKMLEIVDEFQCRFPEIEIVIEDWRLTVMERTSFLGQERNSTNKKEFKTDFTRYKIVDLGENSMLSELDDYASKYRVTCYDSRRLLSHHQRGKHEYLVSRRVLDADLIINIPKMKTHIKAGITCAMKNLIGINGHKEFLPHHLKGAYESGGDNYLLQSNFKSAVEELDEVFWQKSSALPGIIGNIALRGIGGLWRAARLVSGDSRDAGSWSGNETIWRTTLDLNHILNFYDKDTERIVDKQMRNVIHIVDGIVAGEGEGPLEPDPKPIGKILIGFSPAAVDAVAAKMMGYNISRIPTVYHGLYNVRSCFNVALNGPVSVKEYIGSIEKRTNLNEVKSDEFKLPRFWERACAK